MARTLGAKDKGLKGRRYTTLRTLAAIGYPDSRVIEIAERTRKDRRAAYMVLATLCRLGLAVRTRHGHYARARDRATIPE